jgi:hypothetical protein
MAPEEPVYTLNLPKSVAMFCLLAVRKFPIEQAEVPHSVLHEEIVKAEVREREKGAK